jgi:hypothetical protein
LHGKKAYGVLGGLVLTGNRPSQLFQRLKSEGPGLVKEWREQPPIPLPQAVPATPGFKAPDHPRCFAAALALPCSRPEVSMSVLTNGKGCHALVSALRGRLQQAIPEETKLEKETEDWDGFLPRFPFYFLLLALL